MAMPGLLTQCRCEGTLWHLLPRQVGTVCLGKWLQGIFLSPALLVPSAGHSFGTSGAHGCAPLPSP